MRYPRVVYALRHNSTGKVYVGSSKNVKSRIKSHMNALRRGNHIVPEMQADFNQYGDDYTLFQLDAISDPSENVKENYWMILLDSKNPAHGYNNHDSFKPISQSCKRTRRRRKRGTSTAKRVPLRKEAVTWIGRNTS